MSNLQTIETDRPFVYQQPQQLFDWNSFNQLELDQLFNNSNVEIIQQQIENLAFNRIQAPTGLQHVIQCQQFLIQYLLFSQEQLLKQLNKNQPQNLEDIDQLKKTLKKTQSELKILQQKYSSENMVLRMASINPQLISTLPRCLECGKAFADYKYLVSHYNRRHPLAKVPPPVTNYPMKNVNYKLCNCKTEPQKIIVQNEEQQQNPDSSIFLDKSDMYAKIQEKQLEQSYTQTQNKQVEKEAVEPEQIQQFDTNQIKQVQLPNNNQNIKIQETIQGTAGVYNPSATENSIDSFSGTTVIKSGFKHDKQELEALYEQMKREAGL